MRVTLQAGLKSAALVCGTLMAFGALASIASAANTPYNTPHKATQIVTSLVRAYDNCPAPNTIYSSPLTASACVPPTESSSLDFKNSGYGTFTIRLVPRSSKDYNGNTVPDSTVDSDIVFKTYLNNIVDATLPGNPPYNGSLGGGTTGLRITSTDNNPVAGDESGTTSDTALPFQDPPGQDCAGGDCKIYTSADATIPGLVVDGEKSNIEFGTALNSSSRAIVLNDAGGNAFATSGIFVK